jgi:hypothetical protein
MKEGEGARGEGRGATWREGETEGWRESEARIGNLEAV